MSTEFQKQSTTLYLHKGHNLCLPLICITNIFQNRRITCTVILLTACIQAQEALHSPGQGVDMGMESGEIVMVAWGIIIIPFTQTREMGEILEEGMNILDFLLSYASLSVSWF